MLRVARHLHDDRLAEAYFARRHDELIDPRVAEHLADCGRCAARYAEVAAMLDQARAEADADTAVVFTPERLLGQQVAIARRLELVSRPARVIRFPGRGAHDANAPASRWVPRWSAAAVAAGLIVGVAAGTASFQWEARAHRTMAPASARTTTVRATPQAAPALAEPAVPATTDDAFLEELDAALERPRTRELRAFDAFTPHVREVRYTR